MRVLRPNLSVLVYDPVGASLLHELILLLRPVGGGDLPAPGRLRLADTLAVWCMHLCVGVR